MTIRRDPAGQYNTNFIKQSIKDWSEVPAAYGTLIDLGNLFVFTHFLIINALDEDIVLKFGENEIVFMSMKDIWIDNFKIDGIIEYKYRTSAPTLGQIQIMCY